MTEGSESFYEIHLTHRQIVSVFVVLLVCVIGAFFSGVLVGREDPAAEGAWTPEPRETLAEASEGELGELKFFTEEEPEVVEPAVQPAEGATLVEDLGSDVGQPRRNSAPDHTERRAAEEDRQLVQETATKLFPSPPPDEARAEPVEESFPPAPSEPEEKAEPTRVAQTDAPADGVVIQVFSSNDRNQAERVVGRLQGGGHPAFLSPVEVAGRTMYRVRVGPFSERGRAEKVADTLRRSYRLDTWITQSS